MDSIIAAELNKLTKGDLIELITQGKLPLGKLKDGNVLFNYDVSIKLKNHTEDVSEDNGETCGLKGELVCSLKQQIKNLNELVSDKNKIINLLNEKIDISTVDSRIKTAPMNAANTIVVNSTTAPIKMKEKNITSKIEKNKNNSDRTKISYASTLVGVNNNKITNEDLRNGIKLAQQKINNIQPVDNSEYKTVSYKKNKKRDKVTVGNNTDMHAINFSGAVQPKLWLFVSRVKSHVTEEMMTNYVGTKLNNDNNVSAKLLKAKYDKSSKKCFLVGVDKKNIDLVYNVNFWPAGIKYARFNFHKGHQLLPQDLSSSVVEQDF